MDDRFMHGLKRDPAPEFSHSLRERLRRQEEGEADEPRRVRWAALLAPALLVAALTSVILFPSVRASAQAFLDLFRVRNFTAVSVSPDRMKQLEDGNLDLKSLIGDRVKTVSEPGPLQVVASPALAGAAAGMIVKVPGVLPAGLKADTVAWRGAGEVQITADVARLRRLLESLDIQDVAVPMAIDGQTIDLKAPPMVQQRFVAGAARAELMQSRSPEVALPTGVDLAQLGTIGLRILGLDATEAQRLAHSIDWRSTMLIPVPGNVGSFRQVEVGGHSGLLVTLSGTTESGRTREGAVLLWSQDDMVFGLEGNLSSEDLLQMANSLR